MLELILIMDSECGSPERRFCENRLAARVMASLEQTCNGRCHTAAWKAGQNRRSDVFDNQEEGLILHITCFSLSVWSRSSGLHAHDKDESSGGTRQISTSLLDAVFMSVAGLGLGMPLLSVEENKRATSSQICSFGFFFPYPSVGKLCF